MQYNPKLKKAMTEIKEILDKYDIAGSIVLHTPGHGEHFIKVDPSYSCAFFEPIIGDEGVNLRIRTRLQEDFNGDAAKRNKSQDDTVNMFDVMSTLLGKHALMSIDMMELLESKFEIISKSGGHTDERTQNN